MIVVRSSGFTFPFISKELADKFKRIANKNSCISIGEFGYFPVYEIVAMRTKGTTMELCIMPFTPMERNAVIEYGTFDEIYKGKIIVNLLRNDDLPTEYQDQLMQDIMEMGKCNVKEHISK